VKKIRSIFAATLIFLFFSCVSGAQTALPDFEKEPYKLVDKDMLVSFFHYYTGPSVARLYYSRTDMAVGGNYIIVFMNPDGSYEYAEWLSIDGEEGGIFKGVMRGFKYENKKFVFENEEEWHAGKVKSDKTEEPYEEEKVS